MTIRPIVCKVIDRIIDQSRGHCFRSEEEVHGYFVASLQNELPPDAVCIQEFPTRTKYRRHQDLLEVSERGRSGLLDVVVSVEGCHYGMELEYPRGEGLEESKFIAHIENDLRKLNDEGGLDERYLIIIAYNEPSFDIGPFFDGLDEILGRVNLAYLRLAKANEGGRVNPLLNSFFFPKGWHLLVG